MDLFAQTPFGADAVAIAHDQHSHHQLRINRGPTDRAVKGRQVAAQIAKVDKAIDRPQQMIRRYMSIQREVVEQGILFDLPAIIDFVPCDLQETESAEYSPCNEQVFNRVDP
jgi:hypothetical protein